MKENIDDIIVAILNDSASEEEHDVFNKWLEADTLNVQVFENIKKYWQLESKEVEIINIDDVRKNIWKKAHNIKDIRSGNKLSYYYRIAAVLAFMLTFAFIAIQYSSHLEPEHQNVALNVIEKNNLSGVKSTIHLPDGSVVNLNAESSIRFVEGFKDSVRWVDLDGEAYFEVAHNRKKPFIVKSGNIFTTAIGTAFNVNAYPDRSAIEVSLVEGKVEVHAEQEEKVLNETFLEAGQQVSYLENEIIRNGPFDVLDVTGWKDGIIHFTNADYPTVIKQLERWYGVKFEHPDVEPKWNLDAKFVNASLERVLDVIAHSEHIEYQLIEDTVKIKFN